MFRCGCGKRFRPFRLAHCQQRFIESASTSMRWVVHISPASHFRMTVKD